ncbi:MAG: hypothetical protein KC766_17165 [Myxococcales bacterium]|nr:hypothetical protein [Myxococcales bacterium]
MVVRSRQAGAPAGYEYARDSLELGFASDVGQPAERFQPNALELGAAWGVLGAVAGATPFGTAYLVENASQLGTAARVTAELTLLLLFIGAAAGVVVAASRKLEQRRTSRTHTWRVLRRVLFAGALLSGLGGLAGATVAYRFAELPLPMSGAPGLVAGVLAVWVVSSCFCIRTAQEVGVQNPRRVGLRAAALPSPALLIVGLLCASWAQPLLHDLRGGAGPVWVGFGVGSLAALLCSVWLSISIELAGRAPARVAR